MPISSQGGWHVHIKLVEGEEHGGCHTCGSFMGWTWRETYHSIAFLCCCNSVSQLCPALCNPVNCSTPGFPVLHYLPESWSLSKLMSTELMMPAKHLILCHPVLLLPLIFPHIRVFSNELALCIRWPKYPFD